MKKLKVINKNSLKIRKIKTDQKCVKEKMMIDDICIIDGKGYDIEQFLCRCSNKTGGGGTTGSF